MKSDLEESDFEAELPDEGTTDGIVVPFRPEDIDVITKPMTIDLLLSRIRAKAINLQPEFQRRSVWDPRRQSRLIESLLLRIPLPTIYAAEDADENWEIVDGVQRLSTITSFMEADLLENTNPLVLTGMEYLKDLEGMRFEALPARLARRLRETEIVVHLIRRGTPQEVKFNIFARINTGGVVLSSQELRHALIPGPAREILKEWAELPAFQDATERSVRSLRMEDRELVLRFVAFRLTPYSEYAVADMDRFLVTGMKQLNVQPADRLMGLRNDFWAAMQAAQKVFGNDAFRKRYKAEDGRKPINKALFESVSVALAGLTSQAVDRLVASRDDVRAGFIRLCNDPLFDRAISQGTGDVGKVRLRFSEVEKLLRSFADHDEGSRA